MRLISLIIGAAFAVPLAAAGQDQLGSPGNQGQSTGPGGQGQFQSSGAGQGAAFQRAPMPSFGGVNPIQSHTMELLQREEVKRELHITLKQRQAMDEATNSSQQQLATQFSQLRNNPDMQKIRSLPPEQRQQAMQEFMQANVQQMVAQYQSWQGEITEKVKQILKPEQIKRLNELDLQYRGSMAMADPRVAERVKLSSESRNQVARIHGDYQAKTQQMRQEFYQQMRDANAPNTGQAPRGQLGQVRPPVQTNTMQIQQKLDAAKKDAEEKVVAFLSPEEKQNWIAAQGERFTFRKDYPNGGQRRQGLLGG